MAEWFKAPVLKTGRGLRSLVGSNPTPSANSRQSDRRGHFHQASAKWWRPSSKALPDPPAPPSTPRPAEKLPGACTVNTRQVVVDVAAAAAYHGCERLRRRRHSGHFAGRADSRERPLDGARDRRCVRVARVSHGLRKIGRADEEHVDAVNLEDVVDIGDSLLVLDLHADERLRIGLGGE